MGEGKAWTINLTSALCAMQAEQHFFVFYLFIYFYFSWFGLQFWLSGNVSGFQIPQLSCEAPVVKMTRSWGNIGHCFPELRLPPSHPLFVIPEGMTWVSLMAMATLVVCHAVILCPHSGFGDSKDPLLCLSPRLAAPSVWGQKQTTLLHDLECGTYQVRRCEVCAQIALPENSSRGKAGFTHDTSSPS